MTTSDWNEVWRLYKEAGELEPDARKALLAEVPPAIAAEVEAMIEDEEEPDPEPPAVGRTYGRYTLAAALGSGGMGEVFSARDGELGRMVAIKFVGARGRLLPTSRERLIREAQAASALNHPNLVTVYDVIRFESGAALVTELINGQSLRVFCGIARPIQQVAVWGAQIARALEAAHAASIVHTDIKPENIMLRSDGYIKILDFGLAQHFGIAGGIESIPLGTIGYMSPEQTRGEPLTGASDVFSLGVTLIELATGRHPFRADTPSATTAAITQAEVAFPALTLPGGRAFAALLRAMLDKDPARRPTMAQVAARLDGVAFSSVQASRHKYWAAGALVLIAAGAFLWFRNVSAESVRFAPPVAITNYSGIEQEVAFSPDGERIAFVWSGPDGQQDDVYIRTTAATNEPPRRLTNDVTREFAPVWSPDGRFLAWHRRVLDGGDGELWVVPVDGLDAGQARVVAKVFNDGGFPGLAWSPDSQSLISRDKRPGGYPLVAIRVADASKTPLTHEPEMQDYQPVLSPDRKRLLFFRYNLARPQLCFLELDDARPPLCREVRTGLGSATWTLDSRAILLHTDDALWFSADPDKPLVKLQEGTFASLTTDAAGRRYAFNRTIKDANIWQFDIAEQRLSRLISSSEEDSEPDFSPDGARVLFRSKRTGHFELYVCNRDGSGLRQLTHLASHCGSARWSPDGKWIAYDSVQDFPGPRGVRKFDNIYVMPSEGGPARRLTDDKAGAVVPNWSADSRWIYYARDKERQTWKVSVDGGASVLVDNREMWGARESADGKWIWYEQPTSGKGLWRRAVAGGPDERVPGTESLTYRTWELRGDSLVFLRSGANAGFFRVRPAHDLKSPARSVAPAPRRLLLGPGTMSVSPDDRTLLYTSEDLIAGDVYVLAPAGAAAQN